MTWDSNNLRNALGKLHLIQAYMPTNSKQLTEKKKSTYTQEKRGGRRKRRKDKVGKVGKKEGTE